MNEGQDARERVGASGGARRGRGRSGGVGGASCFASELGEQLLAEDL